MVAHPSDRDPSREPSRVALSRSPVRAHPSYAGARAHLSHCRTPPTYVSTASLPPPAVRTPDAAADAPRPHATDSTAAQRAKRGPSLAPRPQAVAASRARLMAPLGAPLEDLPLAGATSSTAEFTRSLDDGIFRISVGEVAAGREQSALNWFEMFEADTQVVPFVPILAGRERECLAYNQRTLDRFARYIRVRSTTLNRGRPITSDAIGGYVSAIKVLRERTAGGRLVSPDVNVRLPLLLRDGRREDGPRGHRAKCLGIGGEDFDVIAKHQERSSDEGCRDFAVGHAAYAAMLRGGEVGITDGGCPDPRRMLTIADVVERAPCTASRARPWLELWVCAIKDYNFTRQKVPNPICRRSVDAAVGSDPRDSYDAIVEHARRRRAAVPPAEWAATPLFAKGDGRTPLETSDVRELARRWADILGVPRDQVGGKSFRIRGATDVAALYGAEGGAKIVQQLGRWHSDVSHIYSRAQAQPLLDATATMANAEGGALEALVPGWTQPAWR